MKKLLFLGLFLLIQVAQAQTTTAPSGASTASKDDDTMVLALSGTSAESWRRLAQVLVQRGYSIAHSDNSLFTLTTNGLYRRGIGVISVAGTVVNDALIVRLYWGTSENTGGGQPLLSRRKLGDRWVELVAIGQAYGGPISYTTSVPD
jgi:DNA mismatch repair ATPase MutS